MSGNKDKSERAGFGIFASFRIIMGIIVVMGCLWLGSVAFSFFSGSPDHKSKYEEVVDNHPTMQKADGVIKDFIKSKPGEQPVEFHGTPVENGAENGHAGGLVANELIGGHNETASADVSTSESSSHMVSVPENIVKKNEMKKENSDLGTNETPHTKDYAFIGEAFIDGLINPIDNELNKRFWGWRPNDIVKFGLDDVMNYQLGVREVTLRSTIILSERISRSGTNEAMNKYLNDAMTCFAVDPKSFWWPSAESEYNQAINDLNKYKEQLRTGEARFYTRPDNLIPLLMEFSNRLGDCDDKLVDPNGTMFDSDDRFYYAQGVATAILSILEAVSHDFSQVLDSRYGRDPLERAMEDCHAAANLSPWFIINGDYDGFFANHRANMAAYISHARFYIGVLITTLST